MRALKTLLITFVSLLALAAVLALAGPARTRVVHTDFMHAPPEVIHEVAAQGENWPAWTPWLAADLHVTTRKVDDPQWKASWTDGRTGLSGEVERIPGHASGPIRWLLAVEGRYSARGRLEMELQGDDRGTRVSWGFFSKNDPLQRIYLMMNDMEEQLAADLDTGLIRLRMVAEEEAVRVRRQDSLAAAGGAIIHLVEVAGGTLWGGSLPVELDPAEGAAPKRFQEVAQAIGKTGTWITGPPVLLVGAIDRRKPEQEVRIAWPVNAHEAPDDPGLKRFTIAAGKALRINYAASPVNRGEALQALDRMRTFLKLVRSGPCVERYAYPGGGRDAAATELLMPVEEGGGEVGER